MLIGKTISGRYRLYDQLGVGGSASVFLARDLGTGRIAVVKIIHPHLIESRFIARFQREVKILQQVSSKHIVEIFDYGINYTQDDLPGPVSYIAMEYVEGLTLSAILQRLKALSENNVLAVAAQIARALSELHRLGIVHRDIKSQNILVTADNTAKIIDFGVAKSQTEHSITGVDVFAGTLSYASPEQIKDSRSVDTRSDLYSLGVVMAECLTGMVPPRNRKGQHLFIELRTDATVPARRKLVGPARSVGDVIHRLLSLEPADRYANPEALIQEINLISASPLALPWDSLGLRGAPPGVAAPPEVAQGCFLLTERGDKIPISRREAVIGRSAPGDDTWIPDVDVRQMTLEKAKTVSRFHCRIFVTDSNSYNIMDMGSFNGTWVNGKRLEAKETMPLYDGDFINLGGIAFTFRQPRPEGEK